MFASIIYIGSYMIQYILSAVTSYDHKSTKSIVQSYILVWFELSEYVWSFILIYNIYKSIKESNINDGLEDVKMLRL
jgi:hypothetical protein